MLNLIITMRVINDSTNMTKKTITKVIVECFPTISHQGTKMVSQSLLAVKV
jgi:hypothetical protein